MKLRDRTAIVTGSGRGIGRAIVLAMAKEGASVIVTDIDLDVAEGVAQQARDDHGVEAMAFQCNVASFQQVQDMVKQVADRFGHIDILVNNAGIIRPALIHKMTEEEWDAVINVHLKGSFNCLRAAAPYMVEAKYGRIVNITSAAGLLGTVGQINYGSAKGGINGFTRSAARELARYSITVNAVAPGAATRMTETIRSDERFRDRYLERIPLGRWAEPEEIAPAVVFLASDDAAYITGQFLAVDGGMTIR